MTTSDKRIRQTRHLTNRLATRRNQATARLMAGPRFYQLTNPQKTRNLSMIRQLLVTLPALASSPAASPGEIGIRPLGKQMYRYPMVRGLTLYRRMVLAATQERSSTRPAAGLPNTPSQTQNINAMYSPVPTATDDAPVQIRHLEHTETTVNAKDEILDKELVFTKPSQESTEPEE